MASTLVLSLLLLFLFFFMLFTIEATKTTERNNSSIIGLESSLSPKCNNTSWQSNSGRFAFGFYPQGSGFAVGIWLVSPSENTTIIVWTANRDAPTVSSKSTLNLTKQGLLLQNGMGDSPYHIDSRDSDLRDSRENPSAFLASMPRSGSRARPASSMSVVSMASMQDSGNFVLYDEHFNITWQSFDHPTDTILGGQNLVYNDKLFSSMSKSDHSSGRFYLSMQGDGNLVAYSRFTTLGPYWASNSMNPTYQQLSLNIQGLLCINDGEENDDGRLCLNDINKPKQKLHNSTTSIYRATLDVDGNLRLYEHQFEFEQGNNSSRVVMLWQALNDTCQVKGFCGFNSYCSSNTSGDAVCKCYPGFVPSTTRSVPADCVPLHSKDDCESNEDHTMLYNFKRYENMSWGDIPYFVMPMMKMETCEKAYQQDCVCGGAIYTIGSCSKYRLPLTYGRVQNNFSTLSVTLLKISSSTTNIISPPNSNDTNVHKLKLVVDNKRNLILILSLTLGLVSLICLVFAVSIFLMYRGLINRYAMLSESEKLEFSQECSLRSFSFDELAKSTGGFSEEIGRGSFGAVYKGTIGENNRHVAVKKLEERIADEGEREFQAEITTIARTHHRNLVKLIGFCIEGSKKLLVYEFVSKGSLANLLFEGEMRLSWKERMKIALDVARGILYLHEECEVRIIHCNINPRNILMDDGWSAKISDFGLARLLKRGHPRAKIGEGDDGTSRYLAPEWQKEDASISVKADIYSFGVVLLEIICCRKSIEMNNISSSDEILLSSWVYQCLAAGQLNKLIRCDEKDVDWNILEKMVKVGLWCVQDHQSLRPAMKNVILMLEGLKDIQVPPSPARLVE